MDYRDVSPYNQITSRRRILLQARQVCLYHLSHFFLVYNSSEPPSYFAEIVQSLLSLEMLPSIIVATVLGTFAFCAPMALGIDFISQKKHLPTHLGVTYSSLVSRNPSSNGLEHTKRMIIVAADIDQTQEYDEDNDGT